MPICVSVYEIVQGKISCKDALKDLNNFRLTEGKNIKNDIDKKIKKIETLLLRIKTKTKTNNKIEVKKLIKKVNNIVKRYWTLRSKRNNDKINRFVKDINFTPQLKKSSWWTIF